MKPRAGSAGSGIGTVIPAREWIARLTITNSRSKTYGMIGIGVKGFLVGKKCAPTFDISIGNWI